jgi:hypothetical protein
MLLVCVVCVNVSNSNAESCKKNVTTNCAVAYTKKGNISNLQHMSNEKRSIFARTIDQLDSRNVGEITGNL